MGNVSKNAEWALWTSHNGCWKQESCLWVLFGWVWGGGGSQNYFSDKNSLLLKMNSWEANSHTDKAAQILWLMVLLWPWQQPTHSWEQLPTDSAINKWISYCYWGLSELTRGTDNFVCLFRKRTLYKRLVSPQLSTDISLLWNLSVEYFFFFKYFTAVSPYKMLPSPCANDQNKHNTLSERKTKEKNLHALPPLQHMQAPTQSLLRLLQWQQHT